MAVEWVANGVVVGISYVLTLENGDEIDRADKDEPLIYLHGADNIISGLENALTGMRVGERKTVVVAPEDGYGVYDENEVDEIEREEFAGIDDLEEGMVLEVQESDDDEPVVATVMEINDDFVVLDYNHPLAGQTLKFDVEVVELRAANAEELEHGHPHGMDDHFHDHE